MKLGSRAPGRSRLSSPTAGFTLVELMITIAIIGILSSVAIPSFKRYKYKAKYSELTQTMSQLFRGQAALYNRPFDWSGLVAPTMAQEINPTLGILYSYGHAYALCTTPRIGSYVDFSKIGATPTVPTTDWAGCEYLGLSLADPMYFGFFQRFPLNYSTPGERYVNYAIEDLDGDSNYTIITQITFDREGELIRGGLTYSGDADTHP